MLRLKSPAAPHFASAYARESFAAKAEQFCFYFAKLSAPAANIFKQEALAAGAELVVAEGAVVGEAGAAQLVASRAQLQRLVHKLALQPFGLREVAKQLREHLAGEAARQTAGSGAVGSGTASGLAPIFRQNTPALMQIINVNFDSFYQFHGDNWQQMLCDCRAEFADVGAASSAPGRRYAGEEAELAALAPVFDFVRRERPACKLSCDTFSAAVARQAIAAGFGVINDISGSLGLAELALKEGARYVLVHSHPRYVDALRAGVRLEALCAAPGKTSAPSESPYINRNARARDGKHAQTDGKQSAVQNPAEVPTHSVADPDAADILQLFARIDEFFARRIEQLAARGCDVSRIILDPGIGFAKTPAQNLALIAHMAHFRHFGLPLLEGSSAKKSLGPPEIAPFLAATSAADIVRVHDAEAAKKLIDFKERLNNL